MIITEQESNGIIGKFGPALFDVRKFGGKVGSSELLSPEQGPNFSRPLRTPYGTITEEKMDLWDGT